MTIYCIAQAQNINKPALQEYGKYTAAALAKHGGTVISKSTNLTSLEGTDDVSDLVVILSFPTEGNAFAWRNDEEIAYVHDIRNSAANWTIQVLGAG